MVRAACREHDPADFRGRPRDRRDPDRFRADRRRPDPDAAAEMAVPVRADLMAQIDKPGTASAGLRARGIDARAASCALPCARFPRPRALAVPRQLARRPGRAPAARCGANAEIHHKQYLRCGRACPPRLLHSRLSGERERPRNLASRAALPRRAARTARRDRPSRCRRTMTAAVRPISRPWRASCANASAPRSVERGSRVGPRMIEAAPRRWARFRVARGAVL